MVVLASAGVCGILFFISTMIFVYLYHKIEAKVDISKAFYDRMLTTRREAVPSKKC
jgi:hypothetical protein